MLRCCKALDRFRQTMPACCALGPYSRCARLALSEGTEPRAAVSKEPRAGWITRLWTALPGAATRPARPGCAAGPQQGRGLPREPPGGPPLGWLDRQGGSARPQEARTRRGTRRRRRKQQQPPLPPPQRGFHGARAGGRRRGAAAPPCCASGRTQHETPGRGHASWQAAGPANQHGRIKKRIRRSEAAWKEGRQGARREDEPRRRRGLLHSPCGLRRLLVGLRRSGYRPQHAALPSGWIRRQQDAAAGRPGAARAPPTFPP